MERLTLQVHKREKKGKGAARSLRRRGFIPGVIYGHGEPILISIEKKALRRLISHEHIESALIDINVLNKETKTQQLVGILKDYQVDPIGEDLLHVDFMKVAMDETVTVTVPIELVGETPAGVREGGILQFILREIDIECLPSQIPEYIPVDASSLGIGDSLHVGDITPPEGVEILAEPEEVVLSISAPVTEEELAEMTTPSPAEEVVEPEVVKKPKEESEE